MFCIEVFVAAEEKAWWCRSDLGEEGEVASLTFLVMETQVVFCSPSFSCSSHFAASAVPPRCSLHTQPCPSPTLHSWLPHCPPSPGPCPAVCHRWNILQLVKKTHGIWSELPKSS